MREISKEYRKKAFNENGHAAAKIMASHFKYWLRNKENLKNIAFYYPIKTEVNPFPLIEAINKAPLKFCLPVVNGKTSPLLFKEWSEDSELVTSSFGAKIPSNGRYLNPDLIITPLLAFDKFGSRLGYGGGFYDRTIEFIKKTYNVLVLGLAFDCQRSSTVIPVEPTDQKIDFALTELGFYNFKNS